MGTSKIKTKFKKNFFDNQFFQNLVFGVDEVGRGCSAGPVVAAAILLKTLRTPSIIKDSKKLTDEQLLDAYSWLRCHSTFAIGIINNHIIDKKNIVGASELAMKKAILSLISMINKKPEAILIDAVTLNIDHLNIIAFNKGEDLSTSIAAASIIAKVSRDKIMGTLDKIIPCYKFKQHKGYVTKLHQKNIEEFNSCVLHRKNWLD